MLILQRKDHPTAGYNSSPNRLLFAVWRQRKNLEVWTLINKWMGVRVLTVLEMRQKAQRVCCGTALLGLHNIARIYKKSQSFGLVLPGYCGCSSFKVVTSLYFV